VIWAILLGDFFLVGDLGDFVGRFWWAICVRGAILVGDFHGAEEGEQQKQTMKKTMKQTMKKEMCRAQEGEQQREISGPHGASHQDRREVAEILRGDGVDR
jgi:hypothetical protein